MFHPDVGDQSGSFARTALSTMDFPSLWQCSRPATCSGCALSRQGEIAESKVRAFYSATDLVYCLRLATAAFGSSSVPDFVPYSGLAGISPSRPSAASTWRTSSICGRIASNCRLHSTASSSALGSWFEQHRGEQACWAAVRQTETTEFAW